MVEAIRELEGLVTSDGWVVGELVQKHFYQTGGNFSVGYLTSHPDGRQGFFKALDFSKARAAADTGRALELMTRSYNFERDVLALCRGANLSKVVTAITDGELEVENAPLGKILYLIFELADRDARTQAFTSNTFNIAWTMRALHQVATGLSQLHGKGIFHQDIKPSNILVFDGGVTSKLADLGRAHCKDLEAPHDDFLIAGARFYAPPEQLYGFVIPDGRLARSAADLYLLGSAIYFFFMGVMLTPAIIDELRPEHRPSTLARDDAGWEGSYDEALPFVREAFSTTLGLFRSAVQNEFQVAGLPDLADELTTLVGYATEPDPRRRGHPLSRRQKHGSPHSVERFVSALNRMALVCEMNVRRGNGTPA